MLRSREEIRALRRWCGWHERCSMAFPPWTSSLLRPRDVDHFPHSDAGNSNVPSQAGANETPRVGL